MIGQFEQLLESLDIDEREWSLSITEVCLVQIAKSLVEIAKSRKEK